MTTTYVSRSRSCIWLNGHHCVQKYDRKWAVQNCTPKEDRKRSPGYEQYKNTTYRKILCILWCFSFSWQQPMPIPRQISPNTCDPKFLPTHVIQVWFQDGSKRFHSNIAPSKLGGTSNFCTSFNQIFEKKNYQNSKVRLNIYTTFPNQ